MKLDRTGIILYTINYEACVDFYQNKLQLDIMFTTDSLTCFAFGDAYLMVELDDEALNTAAVDSRIKTCLRMNVPEVKLLADKLSAQGIDVDYQEHAWGTVAKFYDPDGNLCAFKDSEKFEKQLQQFLTQ